MDPKQRDRYRITKAQPHGKGEKMRPQASGNTSDAQHQSQAPSPNDKPPSEASQGDDAPLEGDATQHDNPQRDTSQDDSGAAYWRPPVASYNLLRILPDVEILSEPKLLIRNPRAEGPQTDICAQVPGTFKHWAARVSCYDSLYDLYDWILGNSGEEHPEIWMYVSTVPHGFVDFYQMDLLSLVEPLSIIAIATRGHPQGSGLTEAESGSVSAFPLLPGLRDLLGPEGSKWLD